MSARNPYEHNHEPKLTRDYACPGCAWEDGADVSGTQLNRCYADGFEDGKSEGHASRDAEVEKLRAVLRKVEWMGAYEHAAMCPECDGRERDGHAPDCELAAALREEMT